MMKKGLSSNATSHIITIIAGLMVAQIMASFVYYFITRGLKTPFRDSLTKKQIEIKEKSSKKRMMIYLSSFAGSFVLISLVYIYCNGYLKDL